MIIIDAIKVDGVLIPETKPDTNFGSHCDGEKFYFFESESERNEFYLTLSYD